jgi:hypothetical protein
MQKQGGSMRRAINAVLPTLFAIAGAGQPAMAASHPAGIALPLNAPADVAEIASDSLTLRVSGDPGAFDVEVTSRRPVRGCARNLVHWAPHGPDPSEILPWQVTSMHFPNRRSIPVCGHPLMVEISIDPVAVGGAGDGAKFTAGTLRVWIGERHSRPTEPAR